MTLPTTSCLDVSLQPDKPPMLLAEANGDAASWAAEHRIALRSLVAEHGSLIVHGLGLRDVDDAKAVIRQLGTLMTEREGFASRRSYAENLYSASKWPPNQVMCMHHELSYALYPPTLMIFACITAATVGGATPVADSTAVFKALPADVVRRFEQLGWLLIRNYNDDIGISFAEAFGTNDCRSVENYCHANGIKFEWQPNGGLRTWQRRSAVLHHPVTGRQCWFNQIAFLNKWTLAAEVREYLVDVYGEDGLPFNTCFGDGSPVGADVVQSINEAYEEITVREQWQSGDLMLVDNIRTAHGREPFEGPREVLVALADSMKVAKLPSIDLTAG